MVSLLQTIGIAYVLFMLYLTFLYYKRNSYSGSSFAFWIVVWAFGGLLLAFPESASVLTQRLHVARTLDFYLIMGLMFFSVIAFLNFRTASRTEAKVEELVRRLALEKKRK
jgi:hypothetical protein